jgi:hypothetical protein
MKEDFPTGISLNERFEMKRNMERERKGESDEVLASTNVRTPDGFIFKDIRFATEG